MYLYILPKKLSNTHTWVWEPGENPGLTRSGDGDELVFMTTGETWEGDKRE